jgi:hypothetical protein
MKKGQIIAAPHSLGSSIAAKKCLLAFLAPAEQKKSSSCYSDISKNYEFHIQIIDKILVLLIKYDSNI